MLDNLNIRVAGKYIFGGTDTSTQPFIERSDGSIEYQGTDERIKYAVSESLLGDVGFTGSDIVPENDDSYFICSHNVPLDWEWTGREEKVQITVGNRTLSVFIPEDWGDKSIDEANTDYNRYRDPGEVSGISLDDLAEIVNRSLEEQGADMLVKVSVEKDAQNGTQQLIMKSNTGEKIGITGWPDTDYMPMPASITSKKMNDSSWKWGWNSRAEGVTEINGLMGNTNILSWKGSDSSGTLTIRAGNIIEDFDLTQINSSTDLAMAINAKFASLSDNTPFASFSEGNLRGRLVLQSEAGQIIVSGTNHALSEVFGVNEDASQVASTSSSLTIQSGDDNTTATKIFINNDDSLSDLADKINEIEGVCARTTTDGKSLTITAQRIGDLPSDRLANNDAAEEAHYPSLTITGYGEALNLFPFKRDDAGNIIETSIKATSERRQLDHSHIDIFDALGMETAIKSREFGADETLTVAEGTELHWRVMSNGRSADIKLNPGSYTMQELRDRLNNAGVGWLEATLETDSTENEGSASRTDGEAMTQRLVIRGFNGEQVLFLDMNQYNYADKMNLSTALRTDAYTDSQAGTGTKCVNFPSAPCVDDNVGVPVRVQMNCGTYYDVNIKRSEVLDAKTGFVDRTKVMKAIVDGVNEQEGHEIMGCTVHVDETGQEIPSSSAIYFLSGEAFSVVDLPFNDPEWNDYSGGLAAQMGIHGGITSNLKYTAIPMKDTKDGVDDWTFGRAYNEVGGTFRPSTIHIENLGHEVDIDIVATDTVKDVMDRIRSQAGDWLYVNYFDEHMGQTSTRNAGDYPLISLSSVDGSAVSIVDLKGHAAQDVLGISTGLQTRLNPDGDDDDEAGILQYKWDMEQQDFPATELTLTVAGYSHTIDLTEIRDVSSKDKGKADDVIDMYDIAEFINARMQDYDVRADVTQDKELVIWSKRGYSVAMEFGKETSITNSLPCGTLKPEETISVTCDGTTYTVDVSEAANAETPEDKTEAIAGLINDALNAYGLSAAVDPVTGNVSLSSSSGDTVSVSYIDDVTTDFLGEDFNGDNIPSRSYYRGGWNLEGSATTRGIDANDMYSTGAHSQNATVRSGANTMRQNGFGVINDVISAIESGNRDDLSDKLLPKIDDFISNILSVMSENGALQNRYEYNNERLTQESAIMTEDYDNLSKIDPADAISQLMVADYMYQANLAIISRLIQPSLLDFLG